jgi:hypothetical protein
MQIKELINKPFLSSSTCLRLKNNKVKKFRLRQNITFVQAKGEKIQ